MKNNTKKWLTVAGCPVSYTHLKKTVLTIAGVTLPLTAAAILLPRLKRGRGAKSVRA